MLLNPGDVAIDYSFARPDPAAIVAAGVRLVVRYISPTRLNKKNITAAERDALLEAGLGVLLVWEAAATDPVRGPNVGQVHGTQARAFADDLGYPADLPIIAAVDFQVIGQQITPVMGYLAAFRDVCGHPMGVYGNDTMVTAAHDAGISTLGWQTRAWSHGRLSPWADCRQEIGIVHPPVATLGAVDDNTVLKPFAAWSKPSPLPPTPPPPAGKDPTVWHVVHSQTTEFWQVGLDAYGNVYARPFRELTDPHYWAKLGPLSDQVVGPLPVVDGALLQAIYDEQGKPTIPGNGPLTEHQHLGGVSGPTGGIVR